MAVTKIGVLSGANRMRTASPTVPTNPLLPALPPIALRRAPYVFHATSTVAQVAWRATLVRQWAVWHVVLAVAALLGAVTLALVAGENDASLWLGALAVSGLILAATSLRAVDLGSPAAAGTLLLLNDSLAILAALMLLGPRFEILALLPGSLLISVILIEPLIAILSAAACFVAYLVFYLQGSPARLPLDGQAIFAAQLLLVLGGGVLFLVAIALTAQQLRRALAGEAALQQALHAAERRAAYKRARIDADAVALQRTLANTLRGATPFDVATSEDLAPLANMINAVVVRIAGLLRDREQRLRLERSLDQLTATLERARHGVDWFWPPASGTTVDYVVQLLRPMHAAEREAS